MFDDICEKEEQLESENTDVLLEEDEQANV